MIDYIGAVYFLIFCCGWLFLAWDSKTLASHPQCFAADAQPFGRLRAVAVAGFQGLFKQQSFVYLDIQGFSADLDSGRAD